MGELSTYVVPVGKCEAGRMEGVTDRIFPVDGDTVMVAGVRRRLLSSRVMTERDETRTTGGSAAAVAASCPDAAMASRLADGLGSSLDKRRYGRSERQ